MPNTARTQMALASSQHFVSRIEAALVKIAVQVVNESTATPLHAARLAYAQRVLGNPPSYAAAIAPVLVMRTNIFAAATTYDFEVASPVNAATDADIESQISTDWNIIAGVS